MRTQNSYITCPRVPNWQHKNRSEGAWDGNTKKGTDEVPFPIPTKEPMETKPERWEAYPMKPKQPLKEHGKYSDSNTDAQHGWWPGKAGSVVTDLLPDRSRQLSSLRNQRWSLTHVGDLEESGEESTTKQVPFLNFVRTLFGSQGSD